MVTSNNYNFGVDVTGDTRDVLTSYASNAERLYQITSLQITKLAKRVSEQEQYINNYIYLPFYKKLFYKHFNK